MIKNLKKQTWIEVLFTYTLALGFSNFLSSCEKGHSVLQLEEESEEQIKIEITENMITGTWINKHSNGQFDYYAFDGNGSGMYSLAADQFMYENHAIDGSFSLVKFYYEIKGSAISIYPQNEYHSFELIFSETSKYSLKGNSKGLDYFTSNLDMSKKDESYNWFLASGPASVDLTSDIAGVYIEDRDHTKSVMIERINNYTVKVKDGSTEFIGYMAYNEYIKKEERNIWTHQNTGVYSSYYFDAQGRLHYSGLKYTKQ